MSIALVSLYLLIRLLDLFLPNRDLLLKHVCKVTLALALEWRINVRAVSICTTSTSATIGGGTPSGKQT